MLHDLKKTIYNGQEWKKLLNVAKTSKLPYEVRQSTYTMKITTPFFEREFLQSMQSDKAFIAYAMIKRDIKAAKLEPPDINKHQLEYYRFAIPEKLKTAKRTIYNIDIKSAYARTLKNYLIILPATFGYLSTLAKPDRLACVGMLASNKNFFCYDGECELIAVFNDLNPLANFFYFCVYRIQQVMNEIRQAIGNDFLFYWVDGIYFKTEKSREKAEAILKKYDYNFTFEVLTDCIVTETKKRVTIKFYKENGKLKTFKVPKADLSVNQRVIEALSLHSTENSIIKPKIKN